MRCRWICPLRSLRSITRQLFRKKSLRDGQRYGDNGDVPTGFPDLARLALHGHSPPNSDRRQRSSISPSGMPGDVHPEFQNIALHERSPSPLPNSERRSSSFPAESTSGSIEPLTEQSGNISDPGFSLPPPACERARANSPGLVSVRVVRAIVGAIQLLNMVVRVQTRMEVFSGRRRRLVKDTL